MARRSVEFAIVLLTVAGATLPGVEPYPVEPATSARREPLVLSFTGDIMHHEQNAAVTDYDRIYDAVRPLLAIDDLSFANLEFPVDPSRPPAGYPLFNGTRAYVEAALRAGVDVLALANNHTFDLGLTGALATRRLADELGSLTGLAHSGVREREWAPIEPVVIHHRGWRIGFVSITAFSNAGGSAAHINLVDYLNTDAREAILASVRVWSGEVDLLIVGVHAGVEYTREPSEQKAAFFRALSDAGAHVVWGHHPHVLQPTELRDGRLIIYSAGNLVSAQRRYQSPFVPAGRWAPTGDTAVYQVRVASGVAGSRITDVRAPLFTMIDDPDHGLVLESFDAILAGELPVAWRAFYLARYAAMTRFTGTPIPARVPVRIAEAR